MNSTTLLLVLSIIAGTVVFIVLVLVIRRSQIMSALPESKDLNKSAGRGREVIKKLTDRLTEMQPDVDPSSGADEFQASPASEKIEDMVIQKLQGHTDLQSVVVDFGTSLDGSLEIWIDDERYLNVEDIPDKRIREAIAEAVEEFNA